MTHVVQFRIIRNSNRFIAHTMSAFLAGLGIEADSSEPPPPPVAMKIPRKIVSQRTLDDTLTQLLYNRFRPFLSVSHRLVQEITREPQHFAGGRTNPKWIRHRQDLATGSRLAGMIGWSPYETPISTLENMLWRKFKGNVMTQFGTHNEPCAEKATLEYFTSLNGQVNPCNAKEIQVSADVQELGLVRSRAFPFAGMSPDGVLVRTYKNVETGECRTQRQLLEFKCPYRHRNLTDHWPAYNLYKAEHIPNVPGQSIGAVKIPVPQYYYTQLMWGGLLLGSHKLAPILANKHIDQMRGYMETGGPLEETCGENFVDTDHPILFIVWASSSDLQNEVQVPECYHTVPEQNTCFVRTQQGAFQMTEVAYNPEFATWMLEEVYKFWRFQYLPRIIQKRMGVLLEGELDVPMELD